MIWTEEQTALLKKLWADGVQFSRIVAALEITPSAIAGKRKRLKLPKRRQSSADARPPKPRPRKPKPGRLTAGYHARNPPRSPPVPMPPKHSWSKPLPHSKPAILIDLAPDGCRWALKEADGIPARWIMCGAERDRSRDTDYRKCWFCRTHARMAYQPARVKEPPKEKKQEAA